MKAMSANQSKFDPEQWAAVHAAAEAVGRNVCGIYRFTHRENGSVYIGQAKDIAARIKQHARDAANISNISTAWHRALNAAGGVGAFKIEVLEKLPLVAGLLTERENYWLREHGAGKSMLCLNTHSAAGISPIGRPLPPVVYLRISEKLKGRPRPAWVKAKISATKLTPEGRARNSAANRGRKHTPEARANMSASQARPEILHANKTRRKGIRLSPQCYAAAKSPENRAKMSAARKGKIVPIEMRKRIASTLTGVPHTEERRHNQSVAKKKLYANSPHPWIGRKHTPEALAKMRKPRRKISSTN